MTDTDRLSEIKARRAKMPQPPYKIVKRYQQDDGYFVGMVADENGHWDVDTTMLTLDDAQFFANAPSDIDYLLAQLEQAEKELAAAKLYQEFVEWALKQPPATIDAEGNAGVCQSDDGACPWVDESDFCESECLNVAQAWHAWQERKGK